MISKDGEKKQQQIMLESRKNCNLSIDTFYNVCIQLISMAHDIVGIRIEQIEVNNSMMGH